MTGRVLIIINIFKLLIKQREYSISFRTKGKLKECKTLASQCVHVH